MRDFLNVPGIESIAQGILQIVETIPGEYEMLEFRFTQNQILLYRLPLSLVVLVIRDSSGMDQAFADAFQTLRSWIEANSAIGFAPLQPLPTDNSPTLKDLLDALNHLSQFTTAYLGMAVIVNYLKASRPTGEWMERFQVSRSGQISDLGELSDLEQAVSVQQHEWFRAWVAQFIRRCSHAVRDYEVLIQQSALTDAQKALLLP